MKKRLICILLLMAMFLTACDLAVAEGPVTTQAETSAPVETEAATEATETEASVTELPVTETQAPVTEATEPETEAVTEPPAPDVGLTGTVMSLSGRLTATAASPQVQLVVNFPEVDLTGAPEGRLCSLECRQDDKLIEQVDDFCLVPGAREQFTAAFSFTRYMETEARLTVSLRYGEEELTETAVVQLENLPDEYYAMASGDSRPYSIDVIRNHNVVIVYGKDESGNYSVPVKIWLCSTGWSTPRGSFSLGSKNAWGALFGGVYGQYLSRITGNILFHSVPYYSRHKDRLETEEYNKLGTAASLGCVRLPVRDAKWIFDFCPVGTPVHIYDLDELPVERPTSIHLDPTDPRSGWDPTDPDENNPWHEVPAEELPDN